MSLSLLYIPGPAVFAGATAGAMAFAVVHSGGRMTTVATDVGLRSAGFLLAAAADQVGVDSTNIRGSIDYFRKHIIVPTVRDGSEKSAYVAAVITTAGTVVITTAVYHSATYLFKKYKEYGKSLQSEEFVEYELGEKDLGGFMILDVAGNEEFTSEAAASICETQSPPHGPPSIAATLLPQDPVALPPILTPTV